MAIPALPFGNTESNTAWIAGLLRNFGWHAVLKICESDRDDGATGRTERPIGGRMKNIFRMAALGLAVLVGSAGLAVAQDRDDYRYDRDYRRDSFERGFHQAREIGYRDGAQVAREDNWNRKPFNPNPRGRYAWANHGYRGEFGSLNEAQEHYA